MARFVLIVVACVAGAVARPELKRNDFVQRHHGQQEGQQSRRHISNDSALPVNNYSGEHLERNHYKGISSSSSEEQDIFFPGEPFFRYNFTRFRSRNCTGNMCESVEGYPEDYVRSLLNSTNKYDHYFRPSVELTNRINDAEKPICQTMEMKVVPKSAMNLQSKEVLIANVEGKKQIVTHELCVDGQRPAFAEVFPDGYNLECKQKFAVRSLLALNEAGSPYEDSFEIPSCCVCVYTMSKAN